MSQSSTPNFRSVFPTLPKPILDRLEKSYNEIKRNFREGRFEPSELNGAKFGEVVLRLLEWHTSKTYTPFGAKILNFSRESKKFQNLTSFPDSVRFHIPKILDALYGIRNKRGVGHVGGDVDPNHMDAIFVVSCSDWIMAELVRIFHGLSTEEAQGIVEALVTKQLPIVWRIGSVRRILATELSFKDKTLVLLYSEAPKPVSEQDLFKWVEHSNVSIFKRDVLRPSHKEKLIEYDEENGEVTLSPKGQRYVEEKIKLDF